MGWFTERLATFRWAKGHSGVLYTAGVLFLAAAGAEIWPQIREQLSEWVVVPASNEEGGMTILGHPAWSILVILGLLFLCAWLFESIFRAYNERSPKFSVSYDNASWSFRKPIRLTRDCGKTFERGISIRAQIQCESLTAIEQCSGYLTKIEYKPVGGDFSEMPIYEPNKLSWALETSAFIPVSIFPRVPKYLGVCYRPISGPARKYSRILGAGERPRALDHHRTCPVRPSQMFPAPPSSAIYSTSSRTTSAYRLVRHDKPRALVRAADPRTPPSSG